MNKKKATMGALALTLALALSGCGMLSNVQLIKDGNAEAPPENEEGTVIEQPLSVESGQAGPNAEAPPEAAPQPGSNAADPLDTRQVTLYFVSADGNSLQGEPRSIPKQEGIARATINELIAGPVSADLDPSLPAGVILEDIDVSNGVCTVDFSAELLSGLPADTQSQLLALYSIVDTLTQFETVDSVRLLVEGQTVTGGLGGVDVTEALAHMSL